MEYIIKKNLFKFIVFLSIIPAENTLGSSEPIAEYIALKKDQLDAGFEKPDIFSVLDTARNECKDIQQIFGNKELINHLQEKIGDLLQTTLFACLICGLNVYEIIDKANQRFSQRINYVKKLTTEKGLINLHGQSVDFKLNIWQEATKIKIVPGIDNSGLSVLLAYEKLNRDAVDFGFNWPNSKMVIEKILSQIQRIQQAIETDKSILHLQEKVGDLIQATLALCLYCNFDIQQTLGNTNKKFSKRIQNPEELFMSRN